MDISAPQHRSPGGRLALGPDGLLADDRARDLLGVGRDEPLTLDRFVVLGSGGRAAAPGEEPWARAARGEPVDEACTWIEQGSGRAAHLGCRAEAGVLRLEPMPAGQPLLGLVGAVSVALVSADDPRQETERIAGRMAFALGAEASAVYAFGDGRLRLQAAWGAPTERLAEACAPTSSVAATAGRRAIEEAPLQDLAAEGWARALAASGMRWAVLLPIAAEGELLRVLLLARREARPLAPLERAVLESACEVWAAALRQGRVRAAELRARSGMRALSAAALDRRSEPPLRELLRMLVDQARTLTRARYAAMGVLNRERTDLADFITVGMTEEQERRIGHLPRGHGLLGAVIREAKTIRVPDLSRDPRAYGFPAHHPRMTSFLGVPLRVGREVFGNFYLTDKEGAAEFTEEDARLLEAFSAQAGLTVAYARETGEQRRLLDAILRQAPHGIVFFDSPTTIGFSNAAARRMLGLPAEGRGPRSYQLLRADRTPLHFDEYPASRALAGESVENLEVHVARADEGEPLPALCSAAPVRSETGALLGAVVTYQDLSPFKALERMREEFSAVVAHDLRSPLSAIQVQLEGLLRRSAEESVLVPRASLVRMQRAGERLQHLISDLLDAARIEGGRVGLELRPLALPELVSGLVAQIAPTLRGHPVSVRVDGAPPRVSGDAVRLEQVVTNLLENAGKYSADASPIDVRVAEAGDGVELSVADRGPGIAPEDVPRLFDRYYQTARAREKRSGLGLGLYIAKGMVEAHGGRLSVESTPGEGSTFRLWLPAARPAASPELSAPA